MDLSPSTPTDIHEANTASVVLAKIGAGAADVDFARAVAAAVDRAVLVNKKAQVVLTVDIEPNLKTGSLILSAQVVPKLPKIAPPATQFHRGAHGELLTQMEYMMGGGRDEAPTPISEANAAALAERVPKPSASASGRLPVPGPIAAGPTLAPIAQRPTPAPIANTTATTTPAAPAAQQKDQ